MRANKLAVKQYDHSLMSTSSSDYDGELKWDKWRVAVGPLCFVFYFLFLGICVSMLSAGARTNLVVGLGVAVLAALVAVAMFSPFIRKQKTSDGETRKLSWGNVLLLNKPTAKQLLLGACFGVFEIFLLTAVILTLSHLGLSLHSSETSKKIENNSLGWQHVVAAYIMAPLMAPIAEELLFRGFIFNNMSRGWGVRWGKFVIPAVISSVFFSFMHLQGFSTATDFFVLAWIFVMGMLQCYLVRLTQSIWCSMLSHTLYNSISLLGAVILLPQLFFNILL